MRQHKNHCAKRSTRAAASRSLQAQLAAGGGPGVGTRSPSPPGTASRASGAAEARHQRAVKRFAPSTHAGHSVRQHKHPARRASTHQTPSPCPAPARLRVNHRHGRRSITATKRTHTQKRRARPSVSLIGLINPGSYLLSRDLSSDKAPGGPRRGGCAAAGKGDWTNATAFAPKGRGAGGRRRVNHRDGRRTFTATKRPLD